ncbi:AAA family ATPase [Fannyhessea vaginae]|uniref:AAA family ATPase n=1 Tax=Fannyhessea vaginae TaxID=82135 RepID=UPI003A7FE822
MTYTWIACCAPQNRLLMVQTLQHMEHATISHYFDDGLQLRNYVRIQNLTSCAVMVGLTASGVSDVNLAAALVMDGCARVVLVGRCISGSLRSRALQAGIHDVWDIGSSVCAEEQSNKKISTYEHVSLPQSDVVSQASSRILNSEEVTHSETITYDKVYQNLQTLLSQFSALVKASHEMSSSTGKSFTTATDACLSTDNQRLLKDNSQDTLDVDDDDIFKETLNPNQRLNKDIDQVQQARCTNDVHDEDHYVNQVDQTCAFVPMPRKPVVPTSSATLPAATSAAEPIAFSSATSPAALPTPTSSMPTAASATKPIVSSPVSALQQTQTATSSELGAAPIISFVSGRGGMGKTALVATCAELARDMGFKIALLDFDLSGGNLAFCFGVKRPYDLSRISHDVMCDDLIAKSATLIDDACLLWGPCEKPEMAETISPHIGAILRYVTHNFDLVFADTSTTFTDAVAQVVQASTRVAIVHDDLPDAISALAKTAALAVRLGVPRTRICRVDNFSNPHNRFDIDFGRSEIGLEGAQAYKIVDGGMDIHELLATGHVRELIQVHNAYVKSVQAMLTEFIHDLALKPSNSTEAYAPAPAKNSIKGRKLHLAFFNRHKEAM